MIPEALFVVYQVLVVILRLLITIIIVQVVLSWLFAFQIISQRNPLVDTIWRFTRVVTDPLTRPIRRILPPVQGFDFAPMVLLLIIYVIMQLLPMLLLRG
ncbi:MAG: YggT family protein [Pseudomonadota bacterium]